MNCEYFEEQLSDYIDGTLNKANVERLEGHLRFCSCCIETLDGMQRVRHALRDLSIDGGPSAVFRLRLDCALNGELKRRHRAWVHPVTWSLTIAAALAILFWPEFDRSQAEYAQAKVPEWSVPVVHRQYGYWDARLSQIDASPMYSHASTRTVSF